MAKIVFQYGMRNRGFSPGCQPAGVIAREDDVLGEYHDVIVYERPLTTEEMKNYELDYIGSRRKL